MKRHYYSELTEPDIQKLVQRPRIDFADISKQVLPILDRVQNEGGSAVLDYTEQFDGVRPDELILKPQEQHVELDHHIKEAIDQAYENIYRFHVAQLPAPVDIETMWGVRCYQVHRPIENVGLYVPGGTAVLPSTALMLGIPAQIAECENIVLATPPDPGGYIPPEIIYIAQKTGVSHILKAGGAQAIAAMAYGVESLPAAQKLFGPGNQYVTAAKMALQNSSTPIAIDMPAGPSEVLVVADSTADPEFVAVDLLSQAEHGADSQVVLAALSDVDLEAIEQEIQSQLQELPRKEFASKAMENSFTVVVDDLQSAFDFSNQYAPEHLILNIKDAEYYTTKIQNAGSVFLGAYSPESVGDYASGTNHTLPTYGYAKMYGGVSLASFMKSVTFQNLSPEGLRKIAPTVETLAQTEQLEAHKQAVSRRLRKLDS